MRLSQVAKILGVGSSTVVSRLSAKGIKVDSNPNGKISTDQVEILAKEFGNTELLNGGAARKPAPETFVPEPKRRDDDDLPQYFRNEPARPSQPVSPQPIAELIVPKPVPAPVQEVPKPQPVVQPQPVVAEKVTAPEPSPSKPEPAPQPVPVEARQPTTPVEPRETPAPAPKPEAVTPEPVVEKKPEPIQPVAVAPVEPPRPIETPQVETRPQVTSPEIKEPAQPEISTPRLPGLTVLGKIDLERKPSSQRSNDPNARQQQPNRGDQRTNGPRPDQRPDNRQGQQPNRNDGSRDRRPDRPGDNRQGTPQGQGQGGNRPDRDRNRPQDNRGQQPPRPVEPQPRPVAPRMEEAPRPEPIVELPDEPIETIRARGEQLRGLTVLGTIELPSERAKKQNGPVASTDERDKKRKRKRLRRDPVSGPATAGAAQPQGQGGAPRNRERDATNPPNRNQQPGQANKPAAGTAAGSGTANKGKAGARGGTRDRREEPTQREVKDSIKATQARMTGNKPNRGADRRRDRRQERAERERERLDLENEEAKILKVTEFVSANDLASLMDVSVNEVIATCMSLGMFVSINQRLDAEAITVIADEFDFEVQFVSAEEEIESGLVEEPDAEEDLVHRAPIVTIMGHVDHGKTSLLDYIRRTRVAAGEAGGITQHIGAYSVKTTDDRMITFLDTPGHEAFTAMRARGAKVTDVVIIVIAADDSVMPQTREAINHAQVAGVPIVFAFSKVDKPGANTEKVREELSQMNMLVEEWGGKYQTQEISSKSGLGISELLEKVLLEAELLDLKANPNKRATGTVIEAELDKGRGYVTTMLVQTGTLKQGDIVLVGAHFGRIRAMTDDIGQRLKEAGPSTPVQILGLPGAPQSGDKFNVMETEREAREIANKREQLLREQNLRTRKHITLEEIGRRKAIGNFKELNVIVKGDVDGSVEALSDSLLQLSTEEVQVNIIHKAVGQISESDILLASASDAIIVGFQVRPSVSARRLAEQEQIEIRLYSIIYDAINEIRDAMEGLLAPTTEEVIIGNIEVRDVFKISRVGTVAGCMVTEGIIKRNNKVRVVRDFIVVHTGEISALKRYKEDVNEVRFGYECGLSIKNFNDIQVGDTIESFELKEVKRTL
ncbi:translation initiation factor IF-2 [Larkinella rosea]|nr:translation initiation factor IF-2 [Larkinella rosea]